MGGAKKITDALRKIAMRYPDAEEGVACEGTAIEKRTIKAGKKAFLFLGTADIMLKLGDSIAEATKLECRVGANGWAKVLLDGDESLPLAVLEKWVDESYRLITARPAKKPATSTAPKKAAKKKAAKKKSASR